MTTIQLQRTIHTGCPITTRGDLYGRCEDHQVRVYKDGQDWHLLQSYDLDAIKVLDATRGRATDHVTVTAPDYATDAELAEVAGFGPRHFGRSVDRHSDGTATVSLWKD